MGTYPNKPTSEEYHKPRGLLSDPILRKIRGLKIVTALMRPGMTQVRVAEELGLSRDTVRRELKWMKSSGHLAEAEQRLREELVPLALDIFKRNMEKQLSGQGIPDLEAAQAVLKGAHVLKGQNAKGTQDPEDSLEQWLDRRREKHAAESESRLRIIEVTHQGVAHPHRSLQSGDDNQWAADRGAGGAHGREGHDPTAADCPAEGTHGDDQHGITE